MVAIVTGATGFVGREVVKALLSRDIEVRCLVRTPGREEVLGGQPIDVHYGDVGDRAALKAAFYDADVVVHLVAVIREKGRATFETVNVQGTRNVAEAARGGGVKHLIYMGALGAAAGPTYPYLHSKWQAEQAIIESGMPYTILRPSIQFGEGDEFVNTLAGLVKAFPIVPIAGSGKNTFQPIHVVDVARCVADTIGREDLVGRVVEIGGPDHLSYNEIVDTIARTFGVTRLKVGVPLVLMRLAARVMEALVPRPPATTQQIRMAGIPNIAELNTVEEVFGFKPRRLDGNIDYIGNIGFRDGLATALGFMPSKIRDH